LFETHYPFIQKGKVTGAKRIFVPSRISRFMATPSSTKLTGLSNKTLPRFQSSEFEIIVLEPYGQLHKIVQHLIGLCSSATC